MASDIFAKISNLIQGQLPEFVNVDHETFRLFLEAYFEWLEQPDNAINVIHRHPDTIDIDNTLDQFIEYFRTKFLHAIPLNVLADKKLLAKNIKDFYAARGTEKSYKLLFRIMYDKDVDFYYPKEDILRASDGKWVRDIKIFVKRTEDDPFLFENQLVTGSISGATAIVDLVVLINEGEYEVFNMFIREYTGQFTIGETITATLSDNTIIEAEICGFIGEINVLNPGRGYNVGDFVPIIDATGNGVNGLGQVDQLFDLGEIDEVAVLQPGTGYRVGDPIIFDETFTQGFGAIARVSMVSPDETRLVDNTIIGDSQNVVLNSFWPPGGDTINNIRIIDYLTFELVTLGGVLEVEVIDGGQNYNILPFASVGQKVPTLNLPPGIGAVVEPRSEASGSIAHIKVLNPGAGYVVHPSWPQADLTESGDGNATAEVKVSGGPFISFGYWLNYDGHLSSIKYLQDNYYYQIYSYVLKVDETINRYRDIVKDVVHPAGMKMFGQVDIELTGSVPVKLPYDKESEYRIDIHPVLPLTVEVITDHSYFHTIEPDRHQLMQFPIFIYHYEETIIDGYDDMVLEDHPGFAVGRNNYARESEVELL